MELEAPLRDPEIPPYEGRSLLRALRETPPTPPAPWWEKYQPELYDFDDADFNRNNRGKGAYRIILLTQGYCMLISPCDYKRMTSYPDGRPKKWCVKFNRDPETKEIIGVYASRHGRGDEPGTVLAHREILGCLWKKDIGDHINGHGLDNRRANLDYVPQRINGFNAFVSRRKNFDLPRGVEPRGKNKKGKACYGGIRSRRINKRKVRTVRSKRTWLSPEPAARWYLNQIKRLSGGRKKWVHQPKTVSYALFPPKWESEPVYEATREPFDYSVTEAIPF